MRIRRENPDDNNRHITRQPPEGSETDVPLYVELDLEEQLQLVRDGHIHGEEVELLAAINCGRRMVATPYEGQSDRLLNLAPEVKGERPFVYLDAMSDLLQAAHFDGLDVEELCTHAIDQQRRMLNEGSPSDARLQSRREAT